jgi:hypothetical protein
MSATRLLERLERVKQAGLGRWLAGCPAHKDRSPSLSIRQLDDGRVLVHDFGGCEIGDVLAAVGLSVADLFPERLPQHSYRASHSQIPARDLLEIISEATSVVAIIAADMRDKRTLTEADWKRLAQAAARIGAARGHVHGR